MAATRSIASASAVADRTCTEAGHPVVDHFAAPGHVARHQRPAHRRRFQQAARQAFAIRRQHDAVRRRDFRSSHRRARQATPRSLRPPNAPGRAVAPRSDCRRRVPPSNWKRAFGKRRRTIRAASTNSAIPLSSNSRATSRKRTSSCGSHRRGREMVEVDPRSRHQPRLVRPGDAAGDEQVAVARHSGKRSRRARRSAAR